MSHILRFDHKNLTYGEIIEHSSLGKKCNRFDQQSYVCVDMVTDDRWEEVQISVHVVCTFDHPERKSSFASTLSFR